MDPIKIRFPSSGDFFSTLKRRVAEHFEQAQISSRDNPRMYIKTAVILGWLLASYLGLLLWADSAWQVVLLSVSGGLATKVRPARERIGHRVTPISCR